MWLCGSQQTVENSWRDGNTRPPDLPSEKQVCRSREQLEQDMEQWTGKGVCQGLFNLCEEYIMQNTRLDESQAGIKIAKKDIRNFRYADDTTLTAERGMKEHLDEGKWKSWLKTQYSKNENWASSSITSWQIHGETMETVIDFIFLGSKTSADWDYSYEIKRHLLLGRKLWPT